MYYGPWSVITQKGQGRRLGAVYAQGADDVAAMLMMAVVYYYYDYLAKQHTRQLILNLANEQQTPHHTACNPAISFAAMGMFERTPRRLDGPY